MDFGFVNGSSENEQGDTKNEKDILLNLQRVMQESIREEEET